MGPADRQARSQQDGKGLCGHRSTEIIALPLVAMQVQKASVLLGCFHAFGNDPFPQTLAHADHGADDIGIVRVGDHPVDKRLIDFERVDRKSTQVAQAGIAGAKVINRELHPQVSDGLQQEPG